MNWIVDNWITILFCIVALLLCVYGVMTGKVKEWLKWAVAEAEEYLGSGTGQLKLRRVYNCFIAEFPAFSKIVPFNVFSDWVDLALDWLAEQLEKNPNIENFIRGE